MACSCVTLHRWAFAVRRSPMRVARPHLPFVTGRKPRVLLSRLMRIQRALETIKDRFKNIQSFEPMTLYNVSVGEDQRMLTLTGHRIVLKGSSSRLSPSLSPLVLIPIFVCILLSRVCAF